MKKNIVVWFSLFALILPALVVPANCQATNNSQEQTKALIIPEGTQIQLSLREPVSSKLSDVGDEVRAVVKRDIVVNDVTVIQAGAEVIGRVTLVKPAHRSLKGGLLHISFDRIRLQDGLERKLTTIVQSASDYSRDEKVKTNGEGTLKGGKVGDTTLMRAAAPIAIPTVTIAVYSGHYGLNGATGTLLGLGVAAIIGSVLLTKGKDIRLEPGSLVRLKLERPLSIE